MTLVLASSSPYRRDLLARLGLSFVVDSPDIDESARPGETADILVKRLAIQKARAVGQRHPCSLVIGSDQVVVMDENILGKPGNFAANVSQLVAASGCRVEFRTGLCLLNTGSGRINSEVVQFAVTFRALSPAQIESYVNKEQSFDCAGGFKSEGLGIALFAAMHGEDPSALVGLPLIALVAMLSSEDIDVLTSTR